MKGREISKTVIDIPEVTAMLKNGGFYPLGAAQLVQKLCADEIRQGWFRAVRALTQKELIENCRIWYNIAFGIVPNPNRECAILLFYVEDKNQ